MNEALHQSALVPLLALLIFGRESPRAWWLLALAFAVSWFGDSFAFFLGGSWAASYFWLPVQFALALVAFSPTRLWALVATVAVALLAMVSVQISAPGPEWALTLVGSITVMAVADGVLVWPAIIYFGVGSVAYLWMIGYVDADGFLVAWWTYQACRVLAFAAFLGLLIRQRRIAS